jgi:hypothetical protein
MVWCVVLLAAMASPPDVTSAQQTRDGRAPAVAPQPAGNGALGGVITNDDGSRPVRSAIVLLIGITTGAVRVTSTDTDGKFLAAGLPADRYIVGASKPPYLSMIAGARRSGKSGTPIVLADAQKLTNLTIRLPMSAAITGLVLDEKGQPAPNVQIGAYQWRMQNGERTPAIAGQSVTTDDRGRYRLFGLAPGEYLVGAAKPGSPRIAQALSTSDVDSALRAGTAPLMPPAPSNLRYAAVFFPGTPRAGEGAPIGVSAGDERANVDFRLEVTQAVRVSGSIVASEGQLPQRLAVSMRTIGSPLVSSVFNAMTAQDGSFTIANVNAGRYALTANAGGQPPQIAMAVLDVNGVDVNGVQLVLRPGAKVAGTVAFRGTSRPPALAGWRVPVRTLGASGVPTPVVQDTDQSGGFTFVNVYPGTYMVGGPQPFGPTTDTVTWTLESVVVDGRNLTDLPIEVAADTPPRTLAITFTDRSQDLSGRITRTDGAPAPEYTVVVFPEDKAYWISGSRRILTARPGTDGKFVLSAPGPNTLPPGRYLLAAVTDLDRDEQYDPSLLNALVPAAVPVTLQPGEKKVQDIRVK